MWRSTPKGSEVEQEEVSSKVQDNLEENFSKEDPQKIIKQQCSTWR